MILEDDVLFVASSFSQMGSGLNPRDILFFVISMNGIFFGFEITNSGTEN
jgi:hypothetical protein